MNLSIVLILLMNILIPKQELDSSVWVGEKFPGYRVIVMDIENENIVAEVGGTSLKMGGDILLFKREELDNSNHYAISETGESYIEKRKGKYYFNYIGKLGKRKFKLEQKDYSDGLERVRQGIFKSHFYKLSQKPRGEINEEFSKFKNDPKLYLTETKVGVLLNIQD